MFALWQKLHICPYVWQNFSSDQPIFGDPCPSPLPPPQSKGAKTTPEAVPLLSGALSVYFDVRPLVQLLQAYASRAPLLSKASGGHVRSPSLIYGSGAYAPNPDDTTEIVSTGISCRQWTECQYVCREQTHWNPAHADSFACQCPFILRYTYSSWLFYVDLSYIIHSDNVQCRVFHFR